MSKIKNIFVLALENRAFDHMLGWSGITGTDAVTGQPTQLNGINPQSPPANWYEGTSYAANQSAPNAMSVDPGHEIENVNTQINFPAKDMSGFVLDFASDTTTSWSSEADAPAAALYSIMAGYTTSQLPILNQLANNFCVCDHYHSSVPGATWPNRFFFHAATAGGIFTSPSSWQMSKWIYLSGIEFEHGSIYDALTKKLGSSSDWKIYMDESGPIVGTVAQVRSLSGIQAYNQHDLDDLAGDLADDYNYAFTFIEPAYGQTTSTFAGGSSQHPMDVATSGEALIKRVYETIRNSPVWEQSMLIVTYDEHGGFYDHVPPPSAVPPGDTNVPFSSNDPNSKTGSFAFNVLGVRVPAVIISPWIGKNLIDHTVYDHSSIPATVEANFGLSPLTNRDANANNFMHLIGNTLRTDCPTTLTNVASPNQFPPTPPGRTTTTISAEDPLTTGHHFGLLYILAKSDVEMSEPETHDTIRTRALAIKTVGELEAYAEEIHNRLLAYRKKNAKKK